MARSAPAPKPTGAASHLPPELAPYADAAMVTPAQAAALCSVSDETIYRWVRKGKLRNVLLPGGEMRIPVAAIQELSRGITPLPTATSPSGRRGRTT